MIYSPEIGLPYAPAGLFCGDPRSGLWSVGVDSAV